MAANEHNAPDQPQVRRPETSDALYDGYLGALRSTDGADIDGTAYTVTIDGAGLKLVRKGRRRGHELRWSALVSGDAALATALNASLARAPVEEPSPPRRPRPAGR